MALTDAQRRIFARFWMTQISGDPGKEILFVLAPRATQKNVVSNWWTNERADLEADRDAIDYDALVAEKNDEIAAGDGLIVEL